MSTPWHEQLQTTRGTLSPDAVEYLATFSPVTVQRLQANEQLCSSVSGQLANPEQLPDIPDGLSNKQALGHLRSTAFCTFAIRELVLDEHPSGNAHWWNAITIQLCDWAWQRLLESYDDGRGNQPATAAFMRENACVMGFGKLGAGELNLSSDIDISFLLRRLNEELAIDIRKFLTEYIGILRGDGLLYPGYRVDLRLRPWGDQGNLYDSLDATEQYYRDSSAPWERVALLRSAPIVGAHDVGNELLSALDKFLFPVHMDYIIVEEIQAVRQQIKAESAVRLRDTIDIKLGEGGIRELEFFIQAQQLLLGGRHDEVRVRDFNAASEAVADVTGAFDPTIIQDHYWHLRSIENIAQLEGDQQTHRIGPNQSQRIQQAHHGYFHAEKYRTIATTTEPVRTLFDSLADNHEEVEHHTMTVAVITEKLTDDEKLERLQGVGWSNNPDHIDNLRKIARGPSGQSYGRRSRQQYDLLANNLVDALWNAPDPERASKHLATFIGRVGGRAEVYAQLRYQPALIDVLYRILSTDGVLSALVMHNPNLLGATVDQPPLPDDALWETIRETMPQLPTEPDEARRNLAGFANEHKIRLGLALLSADYSYVTVARQLSVVADCVLEGMTRVARQAVQYDDPIDIIGFGRYGGMEIGFGSDLDCLYIASESAQGPTRVVQRTKNWLSAPTQQGTLFELDLQLRPYGSAGPLFQTYASWERYLASDADPWERLPLLKARVVGTDNRNQQIEQLIRTQMRRSWQSQEYDNMLAKIHEERGDVDPIKAARGGLLNVELALAVLNYQVIDAQGDIPKGTNTFDLIDNLVAAGIWTDSYGEQVQAVVAYWHCLQAALKLYTGTTVAELDAHAVATGLLPASVANQLGPTATDREKCAKNVGNQVHIEALRVTG